jgi:thiol-disulfide isomerase/thioredoxin
MLLLGSRAYAQLPQAVENLRMPAAFTLVYKVTDANVCTPTEAAIEFADLRDNLEHNVAAGYMTRADMDQRLALGQEQLLSPTPAVVSVQTISVRNGTLFYRKQCKQDPRQDFVLITGGKRWFVHTGYDHVGTFTSNPWVLRGKNIRLILYPGASLPQFPMISGLTPTTNHANDPITAVGPVQFLGNTLDFGGGGMSARILPGKIQVDIESGSPQLLSVTCMNGSVPSTKWEFLGHKLLNGVWIASHMRWTQYYVDGAPMAEQTFELQSSSPASLPASQFVPETWLAVGDTVRVVNGAQIADVDYNPGQGSIFSNAQKRFDAENAFAKLGPVNPRPVIGDAIAAFSAVSVSGSTVSTDQYRGKVLLLDLGATWCGPCRAEIPNLVSVYKKHHQDGLEIVSIQMERVAGYSTALSIQKVNQAVLENGIEWPQIIDDDKRTLSRLYGAPSLPYMILVGRDGKVVARDMRGAGIETAVQAALDEKQIPKEGN